MSVDEEGMTTEERALFDDLVDRITENKSTVLDVLAGGAAGNVPAADGTDVLTADGTDVPAVDETDAPAADGTKTPTADEANGSVDGPGESIAESTSNGTLAGAMGGDGSESKSGGRSAEAAVESDEVPPADGNPAGSIDENSAGSSDENGGGESKSGGDDPASRAAVGDGGAAVAGDLEDGATDPAATGTESTGAATIERATVRITSDVGAIFGVDEREYDLASEDVVSLPVANAGPLVERDAAERID